MAAKPIEPTISPPRVRLFEDMLFLHDKDDCPFLSRVLMQGRLFEPYETLLIRREIRPGDVVLDIGANIGYYTIQLGRLVGPLGKVIAFEPDVDNFQLLEQNVRANGFTNIELVNAAVADWCGRSPLHRSPNNPGDHRLFNPEETRDTVDVEVTTLDAFFQRRDRRVDFIKMDIQGAELHAIHGARGVIAANPFLKLICEFWPGGLKMAGSDPQSLLAELRRLGFCSLEIDQTTGQLVPPQPMRLLEALSATQGSFTSLYCIKTTLNARGLDRARADNDVWRVWRSPLDLRLFERRIYSQNGEDGIIEEILRRIGTASRAFVEFGCGNGKQCNCALLAREKNWSGLFIEADQANFEGLRLNYASHPNVRLLSAKVTAGNVEELFSNAAVPPEFDVLSIDIDGNDYWVWKAITGWRPRVVIIEMNGQKRPPQRWVMPENNDHVWSGTDYYGASLAALRDLGREKGYLLVGCDSRGVNAFFVRSDLAKSDAFLDPELCYHYSPPNYGPYYGGHPPYREI